MSIQTGGTSSGEIDTITVTIDTVGLPEGNHSRSIFKNMHRQGGNISEQQTHENRPLKIIIPGTGTIQGLGYTQSEQ